jgi:hypothetical protein
MVMTLLAAACRRRAIASPTPSRHATTLQPKHSNNSNDVGEWEASQVVETKVMEEELEYRSSWVGITEVEEEWKLRKDGPA